MAFTARMETAASKRNRFCNPLSNPGEGLRQSAGSRSRRRSRLTGDPRADAVRGFIDLFERCSAKISVDQSGGEGVARADRIGDIDFEAWMFTAFAGGDQEAAAIAAGDAHQPQIMRRQ